MWSHFLFQYILLTSVLLEGLTSSDFLAPFWYKVSASLLTVSLLGLIPYPLSINMGRTSAFLENPHFWEEAGWQKLWVIEAGYDRGLSPLIKSPVLVINCSNNIIADSHKLHCSWSRKGVGKITFLFKMVKNIRNLFQNFTYQSDFPTTILPLFSDVVVHWHSFHSSSA